MEKRFSIPYLAGGNQESEKEDGINTKHRTTQTQTESDLPGNYSSVIRQSDHTKLSRTPGEFSNSYLTTTEFSATTQTMPPLSQLSRQQDVFLSAHTNSAPVLSPSPTAIAGECCTECCPVAAAEAATIGRDTESTMVTEETDPQRPLNFTFPTLNYKSFPPNIFPFPQIFGYSSSALRMPIYGQPITARIAQPAELGRNFNEEKPEQNSAVTAQQTVTINGIGSENQPISQKHTLTIADIATEISRATINHGGSVNMSQVESIHMEPNSISALAEAVRQETTNSFSENSVSGPASEIPTKSNIPVDTGRKENDNDSFNQTRCLWSTCAAVFKSIDELIPHISKLHVAGRSKSNLCRWASCSTEKEGTDELIKHLCSDHLNTRKYQHSCKWDGCFSQFETFDELTGHVSEGHIGSGRNQYVCYWEHCDRNGRPFNQRQKVMRHIQTHTGDKPYQCTVCKKRFSEANIMTQHMRTHTGERPYKCPRPDCERQFSISGALTIHLRVHTGEKPFKCKYDGCAKRFAESSNLTKHMRVHTGERPFKCPISTCSKKFSRPDQVTRHLKTHTKSGS